MKADSPEPSPDAPPVPGTKARRTDYPRLILMSLALVVAVLGGVLLEHRLVTFDLSKEPAPFNTMQEPIQWVDIADYTVSGRDSESGIVVQLADGAGKQFSLHFPASTASGKTTYPQVRHGEKLLENPAHVKEICVKLLKLHTHGKSGIYNKLAAE